jgi:hypothetical protein
MDLLEMGRDHQDQKATLDKREIKDFLESQDQVEILDQLGTRALRAHQVLKEIKGALEVMRGLLGQDHLDKKATLDKKETKDCLGSVSQDQRGILDQLGPMAHQVLKGSEGTLDPMGLLVYLGQDLLVQ